MRKRGALAGVGVRVRVCRGGERKVQRREGKEGNFIPPSPLAVGLQRVLPLQVLPRHRSEGHIDSLVP